MTTHLFARTNEPGDVAEVVLDPGNGAFPVQAAAAKLTDESDIVAFQVDTPTGKALLYLARDTDGYMAAVGQSDSQPLPDWPFTTTRDDWGRPVLSIALPDSFTDVVVREVPYEDEG